MGATSARGQNAAAPYSESQERDEFFKGEPSGLLTSVEAPIALHKQVNDRPFTSIHGIESRACDSGATECITPDDKAFEDN